MNIIIAGDFCPCNRVSELVEDGKFEEVAGEIKPFVDSCDYALVNLECPIVSDRCVPIKKNGPCLRTTEKALSLLSYSGFKGVTLANNHFRDWGDQSVVNTLMACQAANIDVVGGGREIFEAQKILYKKIDGLTCAFINCCEHESSIATTDSAGSNPLNPIQQYYAIKQARCAADFVFVIVHGGCELYQLPTPRMQETYRFFIDAGADAVINHHQHCYSGYEIYNQKPIFYGLGNLCFDKNRSNPLWKEGYMVLLKTETNKIDFELIPYIQCDDKPNIQIMSDKQKMAFVRQLEIINNFISDHDLLQNKYQEFMNKTKKYYQACFTPYHNRILKGLYLRGFLPSFISEGKKRAMLNYIECESHRERTINMLK